MHTQIHHVYKKYSSYYITVAILKLNEKSIKKKLTCNLKTRVFYFHYYKRLISLRAANDS